MKIFRPQYSWPAAILMGMVFGTVMSIIMGKNCREERKNRTPVPEVIQIQYDPSIKLLFLILLYLGIGMGVVMGTLSVAVDFFKWQGHQDFPGFFYACFFYCLALFSYCSKLTIQHSYEINARGILKKTKMWWGFKENFMAFEHIQSVSVNFWGTLLIHQKNGTIIPLHLPIGKDFSSYQNMDIPEEEVKNPHFIGSYQIRREIERRMKRGHILAPHGPESSSTL